MRYLILLISILFAYKAKVEPFEIYKIKASVAGSVEYSAPEFQEINGTIVKLDDSVERIELKNVNNQIKFLKEQIKLQEEVVKRKLDTYKRYEKLKTKSVDEKNMKFYDYINAKNQLLSLKSNLSNLESTKDKLLDTINKKNIKFSGYLYNVYVKKGDYVAPGVLVAEVADISKEKVTIFVTSTQNLPKSVIIKGKEFKLYRFSILPDSKYITSYKVEYVGRGLKMGEVVDVKIGE